MILEILAFQYRLRLSIFFILRSEPGIFLEGRGGGEYGYLSSLPNFYMTAYHLTIHIFLNVLNYVQQNMMEHFNLCVWKPSLNIILT